MQSISIRTISTQTFEKGDSRIQVANRLCIVNGDTSTVSRYWELVCVDKNISTGSTQEIGVSLSYGKVIAAFMSIFEEGWKSKEWTIL